MATYTGSPIKRFEDPRLVKGEGLFVDDISLPGTLHAHVVRSPHAHAAIVSIDASRARSLSGVAAVLTGEDTDHLSYLPSSGPSTPPEVRSATSSTPGPGVPATPSHPEPRHPLLAGERVRYVGQPVAVVVAAERYLARDAADLIEVEYEPLDAVLDPLEAMREESAPIHQDLDSNVTLKLVYEGGDLAAAFAKADRVVSQRYQVQRLAAVPLETRGVMASHDSDSDLLTVWSSTQVPHHLRTHLAEVLDRPEEKVRVVAPDVGGGFGEKACIFPEEVLVPHLALELGRPIKWVGDRQENMLSFHGRGHTVDLEAAVKDDGTILGVKARIVADLGAYYLLSTSEVPLLASHRVTGPYDIRSARVEVLGVVTNKPPTGAYRGAGGPEASFCMERTVDQIADELEIDPVELRKRNLIRADALPYTTATGLTYDSGDYAEGFDRALALADYDGWRERARSSRQDGDRLIGVGVATVIKASGGGGGLRMDRARLTIEPSGRLTVYTGVSPHGQGSATTFAQIASDELGVSPADVEVVHGDTSLVPPGLGTLASRGLLVGGSALYLVLKQARDKLARIASYLMDCPPEKLTFGERRVSHSDNPEQSLTFAELASAAYDEERLPPDVEVGMDFSATYTLPNNPFAFAAHVAVVEVSRETGDVQLLRYAAVHDCGRVINPMLLDGQMHGGIVQGIGQALTEDMIFTGEGQPLTGSLSDYAVPTAQDVPEIALGTQETPSSTNPLGVRGVGELPTVAAPAAVANAVLDALSGHGVRHIDTPLTPEKVWRALHT